MHILSLTLMLLFTEIAFANCNISPKNNSYFLTCDDKKGYVDKEEKINNLNLSYQSKNGRINQIAIPVDLNASQLDQKSLSSILIEHGVQDPSNIKIINLSFASQRPAIYKDPELNILSQGCHFLNSPILISLHQKYGCQKAICRGSVECVDDGTKNEKEVLCNSAITKEAAVCPSANECLNDNTIALEEYMPRSNGGRNKINSESKGVRQ